MVVILFNASCGLSVLYISIHSSVIFLTCSRFLNIDKSNTSFRCIRLICINPFQNTENHETMVTGLVRANQKLLQSKHLYH